jgi:hypothetical protein
MIAAYIIASCTRNVYNIVHGHNGYKATQSRGAGRSAAG